MAAGFATLAATAGTAFAEDPTGPARVTVTVTPTIMVSRNEAGEVITVGTIYPAPGGLPATAGGVGIGTWALIGVVFLLLVALLVWMLLSQNKRRAAAAQTASRRADVADTDAPPSRAERAASDPDGDDHDPRDDDPGDGAPGRRVAR